MLIVTLTTDWKDGDYNIGRLKACVISSCDNICIVDITHNIQLHNTLQAAFVLKNAYRHFPPGSVHVVGVNSEPSPKNPIAVMKNDEHFFVGANDGMLSLVCDKRPDSIIELAYSEKYHGFRLMETLSNCIKAISAGLKLEDFGNICELKQDFTGSASSFESRIIGRIIYIDAFGNAITNIDKKTFEKTGKNRKFEIVIQNNMAKVTNISQYYDDVEKGKMLAMFNSVDLLELAINQREIARINSLDTKSSVIIRFID
ncbi:MAG: SAM-dependent chlorinase/fluorinase [Prevotellaceae bacterium]|jgi:S-adenosylmethionine hydrolase|nr:SAM-dependent chlorinase/fluorinase [Prevotellaceae bacterium]